ncbi:MAG: gamma-glutamylcyclotransferase [Bacteroidetes bacterium]|nr:gamma-glutamylcyclotransferase [Bacteroidota bacterium]
MNDKLFVYGTLLDEDNTYGIYVRDNSRFYANARVKGKLYHLGEYPGTILGGSDYVYGIILQMDNPAEALKLIDIYEGFGDDQPQPNEFVRVLTEAKTDSGPVECWIYVYNLPHENGPRIESGVYRK